MGWATDTEIECRDCDGEGFLKCGALPTGPVCNCCKGTGWREPTQDEADQMAEDAYTSQFEGEPPLSQRERDEMQAKREAQWGVK